MTDEYRKALEEHNKASKTFSEVREAYRSRLIGDEEYLAARKAYKEATEAYDAAYLAEARIE